MTSEVERAREVGQSLDTEQLPRYTPTAAAYQRVHAAELRALIAALPLYPGDRVLDATCGEGVYSVWLAERVSPGGALVGVDRTPAALAQARSYANTSGWGKLLSFKHADIEALPFENNTFDLVWADQSQLHQADYTTALSELRRVARPGGYVAMLASDTLDQIGLPWPPALQFAISQAQLDAVRDVASATNLAHDFDLCGGLTDAGLEECAVTSYTTTRQAPFSLDERVYLMSYLESFKQATLPYLSPDYQEWLDQLCTPQSETYLLDESNVSVTYVDIVACARKR